MGQQFALSLRDKTLQEIDSRLIAYLADDLREAIPPHLNRAASVVLFFDTFEAVSSESQNEEHKGEYEQWFGKIASEFEFALTVIAGQNRLTWDEADPAWCEHLEQHLVGGLSEGDARRFLNGCGITGKLLHDGILAVGREEDGHHHCFSLGLCADVIEEWTRGIDTTPESLQLAPRDWERLGRRFLKSLGSEAEARWIERLGSLLVSMKKPHATRTRPVTAPYKTRRGAACRVSASWTGWRE